MSFFSSAGSHPVHDVHVFNNTFVGSQMLGIHVANPDIQNLFIRNNIIVNNGSVDVQIDHATSVTVENNILSKAVGNSIGAALTAIGNSVTDPIFVSAASNDYHLQSSSPSIDKASGTDVATTDFDGKIRPSGTAADLGAFEYGMSAGSGRASDGGGATASGGAVGIGGASGHCGYLGNRRHGGRLGSRRRGERERRESHERQRRLRVQHGGQ